MANEFKVSEFTSRAMGTLLENQSNFLKMAYRGVDEFSTAEGKGYAVGDVVTFKIPGYPTVQRGLAVTPEDIVDRVEPYTLTEDDIYNVTRAINIQSIGIDVVGGDMTFINNPNSGKDPKSMNPQAKMYIDNYLTPSAQSLKADLETEITEKIRKAAFYSPIDRPAKLSTLNSYSKLSRVRAFMNNLGMMTSNRFAFLNENDYDQVASSLQNMFNEPINKNITLTGGIGQKSLAGFDITSSNQILNTEVSPQYTANPTSSGVQVVSLDATGKLLTISGVIATTGLVFNAGTRLAIPAVRYFNKVAKFGVETTLTVVVAVDADGDGAGNVTIQMEEPLIASTEQTNVNIAPAAPDAVEVFPAHRNNYMLVPMGILANPLPLHKIHGADNAVYNNFDANMSIHTYMQGVVNNGVNTYRITCQCPTKAVSPFLVNLPTLIS